MFRQSSRPRERAWRVPLGGAVALLGLASCGQNSTVDQTAAEARIRQIETDWAATAVSGDTSVIETILADDFLGVSPEGRQYTRQDFIAEMKAHPNEFTANHVNAVKVRFFDHIAVAQGDETFTRTSGETARFVWTDTLALRDGKWQIVAAQDLIAPVDGPSAGVFVSATGTPGIDKTREAYAAAWRAGNAGDIINQYADDAFVLYPNQPPVSGRAAILDYFRGFFAEFRQDDFALASSEIHIAGKWAFDRGTYRWKGTPRAGGSAAEDRGKYLVVLERQPNGAWKVARDMDNSDLPLAQRTRGAQSK